MRYGKTRSSDATFDLNLAPILDIIVSIIPLLLLSMAFIQVKLIELPVPQVVADAMNRATKKSETTVTLKVSQSNGFLFEVTKDGSTKNYSIPSRGGNFDFPGLQAKAFEIKQSFPQVFNLELAPEESVPLNDLVKTMDAVRKDQQSRKLAFVDPANGEKVETDMLFPNVSFSNVVGD
jgi:biopolymer transport protein ExbD